MMKNLKLLLFIFTLLVVCMPIVADASIEPIDEIRELIRDNYVDEVQEVVLAKGSVTEIMKHLDPHSIYMNAKEYQDFINGIEQRIVGVGVVLEEDLKGIKITSLIPKGPAERGDIRPGDIITHVNGRSVVGKPVQIAISLISGEENTTVTLMITRKGQDAPLTKKLIREEIFLPNVESAMLGGNIGYIRLNSFATETSREVEKAIRSLQGADRWILDLRDNGGGYITAAQEITGFFPDAGEAFQLRDREYGTVNYPSILQLKKLSGTPSVLINEYSASASEMVAGSVKEQKAAILYGQKSYGKGSMQSMFNFPDGSVLKMTTARFYSPGGQAVDKIGVKPNKLTEKGKELEIAHRDHLLAKLKGFRQLSDMRNVPVAKKFTVEMNMKMDWKGMETSAIELIELGGEASEVVVEVKDNKTLSVFPTKSLVSGKDYLLIIHPRWKNQQKKPVQQGVYLDISVK
ncbi:carboxyl-terminal processing protease [Filibacter limicola]|uniref:Carboxyl-terminal processing protease n=2 Tax=Sporosarcina limicola TaxID=34101 RepID=A0A927RET5_9BACL|nr:carboxyl-terminal processing protease [Sporosarcina limicola]